MKLKQLFEQTKTILEEGLRFGAREKKLVDLEAKDILIGVEYEYHVDEDFDEDGFNKAVYKKASDLQDEYVERKKKEYINDSANSDMDEFNVMEVTSNLYSIKKTFKENYADFEDLCNLSDKANDAFENWEEDNIKNGFFGFSDANEIRLVVEFLTLAGKLKNAITDIRSNADNIEVDEQLDRIQYYLPGEGNDINDNWDEFKTNINTVEDFIDDHEDEFNKIINSLSSENLDLFPEELGESIKESISNIKDTMESDDITSIIDSNDTMMGNINDLRNSDQNWDEAIREGFEKSTEEGWDNSKEHILGFDPAYVPYDRFIQAAEEYIDRSDYGSKGGDAEDVVNEMLRDSSNNWDIDWDDIREVTTDPSVNDGVETITKPLPLKESLSLMEKMFEHIKEIGSTSDTTGMHVNMSIRGLRFTRDNFNPTKLAMLMNERYLKQETKFPIRSYVGSMFDSLDPSDVIMLAKAYNNSKIDGLLELFERKVVSVNKKYQLINFNHITDNTNVTNQRIEFRFFGGEDYERKYDEMEQEIYRTAYMVLVSFSEEFGKKEYFIEILHFLDTESQKFFKMSFVDLAKNIVEFGDMYVEDIERELSYRRSDKYTKQKRLLKAKGMSGGELHRELNRYL